MQIDLSIREVDIEIPKGKNYLLTMTWGEKGGAAYQLSSYTAKFVAKQNVDSVEKIIDLTESTGITLGDGEDNIKILIPGSATADSTLKEIRYGFEINDGQADNLLLMGDLKLAEVI
jgi:hypothetical protein